MKWKRIFGLDPIEFVIFWSVTILASVFFMELTGVDAFVPMTLGVAGVTYAFMRRHILKGLGDEVSTDSAALVARLQDEHAASADFFERRINELEERLDFTERLLTEQRSQQLAQGQPSLHDRG